MRAPITRTRRAACILSIVLTGLWLQPSRAAPEWHIKEAPVRFRVSLSQRPSHPGAGYFLHLPDGGILPSSTPITRVVDTSGKMVTSHTLWQNPSTGLGIVFAEPSGGDHVFVYVLPGRTQNLWSPATGLTPSALLCSEPGRSAMTSARQLSKMGKVGPRAHYQLNDPHPRAPMGIRGDLSGRPRPGSLYLLAHIKTTDPGKTWISTFKGEDNVEVRIDGNAIGAHKRIDKWGGTGSWIDLEMGVHRVEIFAACRGSGAYGGEGVAWLAWATPNATDAELGGVRPTGAPLAGTPKWASRPISANEIISSGSCSIQSARTREGGPVARIHHRAIENYWVSQQSPVFTYELKALQSGNPTGTRYTWNFANDAHLEGREVRWLMAGMQDHRVRLTASDGKRSSVATVPIYAFSPVRSSMDRPESRKNMRDAFLSMIKAHPGHADVSDNWTPAMWQCFLEIQELGKGQELLNEVIVKRRSTFKNRIPEEQLHALQDVFFHWISHKDPDAAIQWLKLAAQDSRNPERKHMLSIRSAEVYMYHKKNYAEAERVLKGRLLGNKPHAVLAAIRLGDVAFLKGNLNEANRYWGKVEDKTVIAQVIAAGGEGVRWAGQAAGEGTLGGERKTTKRAVRRSGPNKNKDWRKAAVLDSNISTSINSLLQQGYLQDALSELALWERFFPLSKLSEDYVLLEARCFMAMDNIARARSLLEAYCRNTEASSYLPDAVSLLERCMINQRAPRAEMKTFYETMGKRLEYHPTGQDMLDKIKRF
jgi:hypothetical protein